MCRNIKTLFNFDPPVTEEEIRAAALQLGEAVTLACFLTDQVIAIQGCRGCVLAVDLANGQQRVLCDNGPRSFSLCGTNWHRAVVADGPVVELLNNEELMLAHGLERPHILRHRHPHAEEA